MCEGSGNDRNHDLGQVGIFSYFCGILLEGMVKWYTGMMSIADTVWRRLMIKKIVSIVFILSMAATAYADRKYVHHDLDARINPDKEYVWVKDTVHLPEELQGKTIHFLLHGNLKILSHSFKIV